jgi:DNA repair protein SbcC/Rad50
VRPLMLTVTAFGPFRNTQKVDFASLGRNALFLVAGATGAGKTTLLDALTYALYGVASGERREERDLRCQTADPATDTKVSLVFETGGRRYLVDRTPTQQTAKKRGTGVTLRRQVAYFAELTAADEVVEGTAVTDIDGVKRRVQQLLGLTADQFRQVVVLPQGEFRKFLDAKHDERQEILSTLFQANRFSRIEQALKQRRSAAERERTETKTRLDELLRGLGLAEVAEIAPAVASADATAHEAEARATAAGTAYEAAAASVESANTVETLFVDWERTKGAVMALEGERPAHHARVSELDAAARAVHVQAFATSYDEAKRRLAAAIEAKDARTVALNTALGSESQTTVALTQAQTALDADADGLNAHLAELRLALPRFEQHSNAETQARNDDDVATRAERLAGEADEILATSVRRETELQTQRAALREAAARSDGVQTLLNALTARDRARTQKAQHERTLTAARTRAAEAGATLAAARVALQAAQAAEAVAVRAALQHQANALATTLTAGVPCPVCGSTTHPAPARAEDVPDVALDDLRTAVAGAREALDAAAEADTTGRAEVTRLQGLIAGLEDAAAPDDERRLADVQADLATVAGASAQLRVLDEELQTLLDSRPAQTTRATQARTAATEVRAAAMRSAEAARLLRDALPQGHADEAAVRAALDAAQRRLTQLQSAVKEAREAQTQAAALVSSARGSLESADEALKAALGDEASASRELRAALTEHDFSSIEAYRAAQRTADAMRTLRQRTAEFEERSVKATAALQVAAERCEGQSRPDLPGLIALRDSASAAAKAARAAAGATQKAADDLRTAQARAEQLAAELRERDEKLRRLDRLSMAADGRNAKRLGLQTYYLTSLFDEVIASASARLERMSHGRYRLKRSDEVLTQRDYAGLELVVTDAFADGTRAVRTLSGGEAFLASLSLALGLSDAVLAQSGTRSLDTLFIDEGFGSLDAETLSVAMATLDALRGEGEGAGRSVGLISHIEEVKSVVTKRIVVTRRPGEAVSSVEVFV